MLFLSSTGLSSQFTITNYNSANAGLPSNYLGCVTIDEENVIWLGGTEYAEGEGGMFRLEDDVWEFFELDDSLYDNINHIFEILLGPEDDIWVISYGHDTRITRVDSNGQTDFTPGDIFGTDGLSFGKSIWFVDWWSGLYEYNYDSLNWIFHNNFPVSPDYNPITSFDVDSTGTYWLGIGSKNMYRYKDTIITKIELFPELPPKFKTFHSFRATDFSKDGSVWFATSEGLVHWFNDEMYFIYDVTNSNIPSNRVSDVLIDQRGFVWTTFYDTAVAILTAVDEDFIIYDQASSIIKQDIRDIEEDDFGNIWLASWGNGAYKMSFEPTSIEDDHLPARYSTFFPNPIHAGDELTICTTGSFDSKAIGLWTMDGKLVQQIELDDDAEEYVIPISNHLRGLYFFVITGKDGDQFVEKIMVRE